MSGNFLFANFSALTFLKNIPDNTIDDNELIELYKQAGDLTILGRLYQRYMDLVYGVCLKYLKDPEPAKDAVMQIFEELVSKVKKHDIENFRGWLHQVAKNHCLMQLRTPKNLKTVELKTELVQSGENVHLNGILEKEENFKKLDYCLGQLQSEQKKVIELFYLQGKCYNEIAELTGIEWSGVRSYIQNGRRNLKICMESPKTKAIVENDVIKK